MDYIEEVFTPLVQKCKSLGRAMRIGTNHGACLQSLGCPINANKACVSESRPPPAAVAFLASRCPDKTTE